MDRENIKRRAYLNDLEKIRQTIDNYQNEAILSVYSAMIMTYHGIGTIINKRKNWGNKYINDLSNDLRKYGKGYSTTNLKLMCQFANEFNKEELARGVCQKIPWFTIVEIMRKSHSHEEMLWYIQETKRNGWSRVFVLNQMAMKAYEGSLISPSTTEIAKANDLANELFKDTYVFDFLDKEKIKTEKDLKNQLVNYILKFLSELGPGFSLVGKEYKLETPSKKDFYIDLLMYHTKIHAYVVIEVKLGEFVPSDLGQLVFYVNAIDDLERTELDEETIGLLLCKEADAYVAKTSLSKSSAKLGISKYKLIDELPDYLIRRLNEKM